MGMSLFSNILLPPPSTPITTSPHYCLFGISTLLETTRLKPPSSIICPGASCWQEHSGCATGTGGARIQNTENGETKQKASTVLYCTVSTVRRLGPDIYHPWSPGCCTASYQSSILTLPSPCHSIRVARCWNRLTFAFAVLVFISAGTSPRGRPRQGSSQREFCTVLYLEVGILWANLPSFLFPLLVKKSNLTHNFPTQRTEAMGGKRYPEV